ncbi:hypothetical protein KI387_025491, partial [Taxus chinensis]
DDDDEPEGGEDHLVYEIHDYEEEGDEYKEGDEEYNEGDEEKENEEETEAQGKEVGGEENTKYQRTPSLTKELGIHEAAEREVEKIIKDMVEQEVECSVNVVMREVKEESIGKEYTSMQGDPCLA